VPLPTPNVIDVLIDLVEPGNRRAHHRRWRMSTARVLLQLDAPELAILKFWSDLQDRPAPRGALVAVLPGERPWPSDGGYLSRSGSSLAELCGTSDPTSPGAPARPDSARGGRCKQPRKTVVPAEKAGAAFEVTTVTIWHWQSRYTEFF
jgi:hypothetical protein